MSEKYYFGIQHYMEPTAQFNISPPPWKTATMLDFLKYNLYLEMPFLSFHNPKSFDRETQAFLENGSAEENILSR